MPLSGHDDVALLNDVIIVSLTSETMGKLINENTRLGSFNIKLTRPGFENAC